MAYSSATSENVAELTWEIAQLAPNGGAGLNLPPDQGHWREEEYLALDTNRLIEYSHGRLEVLPMPTFSHQRLVAFLYRSLMGFIEVRGLGVVMFAPLRVQLWRGKFREPDIVFMATEHADRLAEQYWHGADLVMEVVSPDDRAAGSGDQAPRVCAGGHPRILDRRSYAEIDHRTDIGRADVCAPRRVRRREFHCDIRLVGWIHGFGDSAVFSEIN